MLEEGEVKWRMEEKEGKMRYGEMSFLSSRSLTEFNPLSQMLCTETHTQACAHTHRHGNKFILCLLQLRT